MFMQKYSVKSSAFYMRLFYVFTFVHINKYINDNLPCFASNISFREQEQDRFNSYEIMIGGALTFLIYIS